MRPTLTTPFRVLWRRRALEKSCAWTRPELERHQQERLHALRRFASAQSPFYRRFHKGLDDRPLQALPILSKSEMMAHFDDVVTDRAVRLADAERFLTNAGAEDLFRGRYVVLSTSGSTGQRGVFVFSRDEWLTVLAMIARPIAWASVGAGVGRRPRSAMLASTTPWHYSTRIGVSLTSRLLPSLRLNAAEPIDTMVSRLNDWQPDVLAVYPSVLRQLADEQIAGRLRISLRGIHTSAEVLDADIRRRVRDAWGIPVFDTYGATEYAPIAAECAHGRKHLFEDGAIIEVVDENGRAVPPGERGDRLLLTVLNRRTQPLIRYEISDVVRLAGEPCECGRSFAVVESIEGRVEDSIWLPDATDRARLVQLHPNVFHDVMDGAPTAGWQLRQRGADLTMSVVGMPDAAARDALAQTIRLALERQGAAPASVTVTLAETLDRGATGKAPLIIRDRGVRPQTAAS
jgi:putative adenylate-forming enzyme